MDENAKSVGILPLIAAKANLSASENALVIGADLKEVEEFCVQEETSYGDFFKAVWAVCLSRITEKDSVCFGFTHLDNKPNLELRREMGLLQASVTPETALCSLLRGECFSTSLCIDQHNPTHKTAVCMVERTDNIDPGEWPQNKSFEELDIIMVAGVSNICGSKDVQLLYRPSAFPVFEMSNVCSMVSSVIASFVGRTSLKIQELSMFSEANRRDVLRWNDKKWETGKTSESILDWVHRHATERPNDMAVCSWDAQWTYEQLEYHTIKLASHLRDVGVKDQVMVPLTFEKSSLAILAELAVMKAGGAFVPIDPSLPFDRVKHIINEIKASVGLASAKYSTQMAGHVNSAVTLSHESLDALPLSPRDSLPRALFDSPAYVLFTSGSTGQPKGCVINHGALSRVPAQASSLDIQRESRVLQFASFSFAASIIEIYITLSAGGTICIPSDSDRLNRLSAVIDEMRVSWAMLTPSAISTLAGPVYVPLLKTLVSVGEALGRHQCRVWAKGVRLYEALGCSEYSGIVCVSEKMESEQDCGIVGRSASANTWVVDTNYPDRLAPVGVVGELWIDGPALARGYLNDPERTKAVFVDRPRWMREMNDNGAATVYRTGDLVQYVAGGSLRYVARKDAQVKIRGQRVELKEVEFQIRQACPEIDAVFVEADAPSNSDGSKIIVAFLFSNDFLHGQPTLPNHPGLGDSSAIFRAHVKEISGGLSHSLPPYMHPSVYLPLRHVPKTLTGKIDRKSLRAIIPLFSRWELEQYQSTPSSIVPPTTELEKRVHAMFSDILQIHPSEFGVNVSFINLGGDSVLAMRLANRCLLEGLPLTASTILGQGTIAAIAISLQNASEMFLQSKAPTPSAVSQEIFSRLADLLGLDSNSVEGVYPCSAVQQGMLFSQLRDQRLYKARIVWEIQSNDGKAVDIPRFEKAWHRLCDRHPILRTQVCTDFVENDKTYQLVRKSTTSKVPVVTESNIDPMSLPLIAADNVHYTALPHLAILIGFTPVRAVLDINHLLMDGLSVEIMMRDLEILYGIDDARTVQDLGPVSNYHDYVTYLAELQSEKSISFWESKLSNVSPCMLPSLIDSHAMLPVQELRSHTVELGDLSPLIELCQSHDVTLASLFKMAWGLLLRCYTGSETVCFGDSVSGRDAHLGGVNNAVGAYIHQTICQIEFDENTCVSDQLRSIHADFISTLPHKHVPLAEIEHAIGIGETKLFNTGLSCAARVPNDFSGMGSIDISEIDRVGPTEYDVVLEVHTPGQGVQGILKYWSQALDDQQARRLGNTLRHIISEILRGSGQMRNNGAPAECPKSLQKVSSIGDLQMIGAQDLEDIWSWNGSSLDTVNDCVHNLIDQHVRLSPTAEAVCAWDGKLTYQELDTLSTRFAQHLAKSGLGPGSTVPLLFEKSLWMPVAVLSVMKAGGASVALDITQPIERLQSITNQVDARIIVCSHAQSVVACQLGVPEVCTLDRQTIDSDTLPTDMKLPSAKPTDLVYLVFTSGSTGTPKGVMISHQNFCSAVKHHQGPMGITSSSRVFDFVTYAFDIAWSNILHSMTAGACLCIPSEDDRQSNISRSASLMKVNYAFVTPTVARLMNPSEIPTLRTLLCGGELLTESDVSYWTPQVDLRNTYGPAECTIISNAKSVNPHRFGNPGLGKGVGCNLWIVNPDSDAQLMPVGCTGELWIEGPIVGNGYLGDPAKTAATFLNRVDWPSPKGRSHRQWRLYKTGDLVRYDPSGNIVFVRRKDGQVKIRGQRVEMGEIEYHARQFLQGKTNAGLVAEVIKPSGSPDPMLVIFLPLGDDADDSDTEILKNPSSLSILRQYTSGLLDQLRSKLPSYMIPAAFIPLSQIPVTANGKTDRRKLRQIGSLCSLEQLAELNPSRTQYRQPSSDMERALQQLWASVLNINPDSIGACDSFLQIGGDSVGIMRLVGKAREQNLTFSVAQVFQNPRLEDLAQVAHQAEAKEEKIMPFSLLGSQIAVAEARVQAAQQCRGIDIEIEDLYPCTPLQEGLISLSSYNSDYVDRSIMELRHAVDLDRFQSAWEHVIASQPILRTRVVNIQGQGLVQAVVKETVGVARSDDLKSYLSQDASEPMGLGTRLARFALIHAPHANETGNSCFVLTLHHAVYDAWSIPLILDQFVALYNGLAPAAHTPFQNFIKEIKRKNPQVDQYWKSQLEGPASGFFPALPNANYQPRADRTIKHSINGLQWPSSDITSPTAIRAAWSILTAHYTNVPNVIFGAIMSGRQIPVRGIEKVAGPTIATVPVRVAFDWHASAESLMDNLQKQAVDMTTFEQTGLQNIRKISEEVRENSQFQTLLIILPMIENSEHTARDQIFERERGEADRHSVTNFNAFSSYALNLLCQVKADGVELLVSYDSHVIDEAQMQRILGQFQHILEQLTVLENGKRPVSEISAASPQDVERIWTWNAEVPATCDRCVHVLISQIAERNPELTAVCAWDGSLSYKELDDRSSRLAHHLKHLGVGSGSTVPLYIEKSLWMPVVQLAVMKTGAASVSLDISQPAERLKSIIQQVQPSVIIASTAQSTTDARQIFPSSFVVDIDEDVLNSLPMVVVSDLPPVSPSSPMYVVFTSGSTGTPKGVVITHSNISSALFHQEGTLELGPGFRVFDFASYAFDISWLNFFKTLTSGACLCIPSDMDRKNDIAGSITKLEANFACLTPSVARIIRPDQVPCLKTLVLAGETPTASDYISWATEVDLRNAYGPAECTPLSTSTKSTIQSSNPANVGSGMGLNMWIVDQANANALAPIGSIGELWLEGPLVGCGYHLAPEKTSEAFVENPLWLRQGSSKHPGREGRLYSTGDLARYDHNGSLIFVGRKDTQVKIRGQRVELNEVEHHVQQNMNEEFSGAVAAEVIVPVGHDQPILAAFLSMEQDGAETSFQTGSLTTGLADRLAEKLPMFMIPKVFIPIGRIPRGATGKVDYGALRAMGSSYSLEQLAGATSGRKYREPATGVERILQKLWASTLNISPQTISASDSFLEIGGDSITAMQLVSNARDQGALCLTVADVFRYPRLEELAQNIRLVNENDGVAARFSLVGDDRETIIRFVAKRCSMAPSNIEDVYPCTPLQEGMMSSSSRRPGAYINRNIFELRDSVDLNRLKEACELMVDENPVFRTRIVDIPHLGLMQAIVTERLSWSQTDNLGAYIEADKQVSMDLASPLARFCLIQEGKSRFLVITLHHAIYDGWSMSLALDSMEKTFFGEKAPYLFPFRHFIKSVSHPQEKASSFWRDQFEGIQAQPFPRLPSANYQPQANSNFTHKVTGIQWPSSGITASSLLRAAWALLTAHYHPSTENGTKEALFGVTVSGRQGAIPGVDKVVGPTIATVPVRVQLSQEISIREFLDGVQRQSVDMIEFEQTGLQKIQQISDDGNHATQFQSLLVVQPISFSDHYGNNRLFKPASEEIIQGYIAMLSSFSSYSVMLLCQLNHDGVDLIFSFDSEVIETGQVERVASQMDHILKQLCHFNHHEPEDSIESIEILSPADKIDILRWNSKATPLPDDGGVHNTISSHALHYPDAQAISAWDGELSYSGLEEMSTKIALVLSSPEFGVSRGDIVALHLEKSMWMPVFMISVMKLGATVVQVSSSTTQSRFEAISKIAAPKVILTNISMAAFDNMVILPTSRVIEHARKMDLCSVTGTVNLDDRAHILFTSGSTGVPKGIAWTHRALAANVKAISTLNISSSCRIFQFVSYDFDVSIIETYAAFANGACLCIPSETERLNSPALTMARMDVNWVSLTPSTTTMISPESIPSLQTCVFAGEVLPESVVNLWSQSCTIFNWYGPAEFSTAICCQVSGDKADWKPGVIGYPLASSCWIVDTSDPDTLLPVGAIGELLLEGPPMMCGYVGGSTSTGSFLTPRWLATQSQHPGCDTRGKIGRRLYRTGDLVQYQTSGIINYLGRKDTQVKIRGQRVELSEVETHLRQCLPTNMCASVAAEVIRPSSSDPLLAAFIATTRISSLNGSSAILEARQELFDRLPRYMVPSAYIPVGSIPLTRNGKVDRSKLRAIGDSFTLEELAAFSRTDGEYRKPATTKERALQSLWGQVMGITPQRACDNFFHMGGDSVTAMRLVSAARDGGFALSVSQILKHPRLEKLAEQMQPAQSSLQVVSPFSLLSDEIDSTEAKLQAAQSCGVAVDKIENLYPCTALQQGMISLTVRRSGNYVNRSVLDLNPHVDISRLKKAWQAVIRDTPILRTRIVDLPSHGLFQAVLHDEEYQNWSSAHDLQSYMITDKNVPMGLGTPLARFAMVTDDKRKTNSVALTLHHALYDGWCFPYVLDAVQRQYYGSKDSTALLPFDTFIKYCTEFQSSPTVQSFWDSQFRDFAAEPFPSIPTAGHEPKADQAYQHDMCGIRWPKIGITPSSILRAAWAILTARYQNTTDVIFGATVTGRQAPIPGIEKIMGPTIATVPIRVSFSWEDSVQRLLDQVQQQAITMVDFEQTGMQNIQQLSAEGKKATKFQTLLVVQPDSYDRKGVHDNMDILAPLTEEQKAESVAVYNSFSSYALMLIVQLKQNGEAEVYVSYDSQVLDLQQIQRLTQQMEHIIRQLCADNGDQQVRHIQAASGQDLEDIWGWNDQIPTIEEILVPELVARRVLQCPERMAIDAWDGQMTYADMSRASTDLAIQFSRLGLQRNDVVALHFEKSMWMPITMMATLKVGATVLQFSEAQTGARMNTIFTTLPPRFVVTNIKNQSHGTIKTHQIADILRGSASDHHTTTLNTTSLLHESHSDKNDPAHVIFTSGSTGVPKGMVWHHASLSANVQVLSSRFKISPSTRVFQFVSYDFDVSNIEAYATFAAGACLCIPNEADRIGQLTPTMSRFEANWVFLTPSASEMLHPAAVPSLQTLVFGGEKLLDVHIERFLRYADIFNWYGPGEAALTTLCSVDRKGWTPGLIGPPLASSVWVVDPSDTEFLLPVGAVGELLVFSPSMMYEYVKGTADGTDHFVKPGWLARETGKDSAIHEKLYRTADLVRHTSDGSLVYVGRKDAQVKIRGQRVELTDIEAHIRSILSERSVDVPVVVDIICPRESSDQLLAAFIPIGDSADAPIEEIRKSLSPLTRGLREKLTNALPRHMIPAFWIPVNEIPLTPNAKANRKSLRSTGACYTLEQLAQFSSDRDQAHSEPTTRMERVMRELWASTLKVDVASINTRDSFLQIGGDSIAAMRLVGAARKEGLLLTVADIFQHPRLIELALCVTTAPLSDESDTIPPFSLLPAEFDADQALDEAARQCNISSAEIEDIYPCTPLQEGLLAMTQTRPGSYVSFSVRKLQSNVDIQRLRCALHDLINRVTILRTRIVDLPGIGLVQVVISCGNSPWSESTSVDDFHRKQMNDPMTIGTSLSRFSLIDNESGTQMAWMIHHALYDGWSMPLMLEQLTSLYLGDDIPNLPPFSRFIDYLGSSEGCSPEFWKAQLTNSEASPFPEIPSVGYEPHANELFRLSLPKIQWPTTDITASTVIRAAWALLTAQYSSSSDTIFGVTMTGRQIRVPGVERMAGPTITTVPVRINVAWDSPTSTFLDEVQAQMVDMIPHEQAGLQNIRKISPEIDQASQFQTLLVVQPASNSTQDNAEGHLFDISAKEESDRRIAELNSFTSYAIMWMCHVEEDGIDLSISFDSNIVPSSQVQRMGKHFEHIVRVISSPQVAEYSLSELDLLSEQDLDTIWESNASVPPATERPLYELISVSAKEYPEALAINAWDGKMTYSELDRTSSELASRLVALGARPTVTIPLHFEKSMWMPVAILAVLKSGSSFVQLSTALSMERMEAILKATNPSFALSSFARHDMMPTGIRTFIVPSLLEDMGSPTIFCPPAYSPDAISNVLFTSGSTGVPKGIKWSHRALSTNIRDAGKALSITRDSHVFQFASYDFDVSILESLATLLHGACLCIPSEDERKNSLAKSITKYNTDTIFLTPSVSEILSPELHTTLKTVIFGGEALSRQTVLKWAKHVTVKNYYGPAECSSASHCTINPSTWTVGDIGKPDAVVFWVVDPTDHDVLVPIGAVGELLVEGPTLSSGFINKDTADVFVYPKWLAEGSSARFGRQARAYKTGDLVRQINGETFVYVGRKDAQVKIRGQRVELSEVEYYLNRFKTDGEDVSFVAEAVTPLGGTKPILVAFLAIGEAAHDEDEARLRVAKHTHNLMENLASKLPAYMVPNAFIPIASIPTTTTSKVNRRILRDVGATFSPEQLSKLNSSCSATRRKPNSATECIVQKLWSSVLRLEEESIGLDDNFLVLGGDSIKAMQFVRKANEHGLNLAVTDVFLHPRLVDLASAAIENTNSNEDFDLESLFSATKQQLIHSNVLPSLGLSSQDLIQAFPVSDFQKFYVFAVEEDTLEKFVHCYIDLPTGLNVSDVERNCDKLWDHLDILRMVFLIVDGTPIQALFQHFSPPIDVHEVHGNLHEASERVYRADFAHPYERGRPVTRFIITHNEEGQIRLALRISHAQFDGLSLSCFLSTFSAFSNGVIPPQNPTFAHYIAHVMKSRGDGYSHWRSLLNESRISWPTWYSPAQALTPSKVHQEAIMLSKRVPAPQNYRENTPSAVFATICGYTIARLTHSDDVVLGYLTTGRPCLSPTLQEMAGPCVNIVPLRISLQGENSFAESLSAVQKQRIEGFTRDSDQLSDIVHNCTDWPSDTEHFGFGVHFLNIEDQLKSAISDSTAQLIPHTVKPAITFPTVILAARPRGVDEWEVEVRGGGDFHSKEDLESVMEAVIAQIALHE